MYRLLRVFLPDAWLKIQVRRVHHEERLWTLSNGQHKYSTRCLRDTVEIRSGKHVGKIVESGFPLSGL